MVFFLALLILYRLDYDAFASDSDGYSVSSGAMNTEHLKTVVPNASSIRGSAFDTKVSVSEIDTKYRVIDISMPFDVSY